ncbi:MAG TPA: SLBB domain-containing protein [Gemmatimonadaceae bacterium]|nr:SLBB domain-containing protein [Gemmatimonadaceae bacterium]
MVGFLYLRTRAVLVSAAILSLAAARKTAHAQAAQSAASRTALLPVTTGDHIVLHFLREPTLNAEVTVDDRGEAAFPKIGILQVSRFSIGSLQDTLRARYAEFLRIPEMEISVLRRIVVNGEVRQPNVYMVDAYSTVRDVIARAGGIGDAGNRNKVLVVRDGQEMRVKNWQDGDDSGVDLRSGDQVLVAKQSWIKQNALSVISTGVLVASFVISQVK